MSRSIAFVCGLLAASAVSATAWAATPTSLYNDNCSACHQTTGKGVKGAFPALAGDPVVQGDAAPLTATVLAGKNEMPAFSDMSDPDLASVLTYVRSAWGNKGTPVTPADVAAARAKLKGGK